MLLNQIMSQLHTRAGAAPSNFAQQLPAGDSELMQQTVKDPYNLEFLTLADDAAERDLERAIVTQIETPLDKGASDSPHQSEDSWASARCARPGPHWLADHFELGPDVIGDGGRGLGDV